MLLLTMVMAAEVEVEFPVVMPEVPFPVMVFPPVFEPELTLFETNDMFELSAVMSVCV